VEDIRVEQLVGAAGSCGFSSHIRCMRLEGRRTDASNRILFAKIIGCVGIGGQSEGATIGDGCVNVIVLAVVEANVESPL
jgi:hypothetical protein